MMMDVDPLFLLPAYTICVGLSFYAASLAFKAIKETWTEAEGTKTP